MAGRGNRFIKSSRARVDAGTDNQAITGNRDTMNPAWHIRKAIPDDSDKLENCMKSAYAIYEQRMGGRACRPWTQIIYTRSNTTPPGLPSQKPAFSAD